MPERLQLSRKRGSRLPGNAKSVARPSQWGNPFRIGRQVTADDRDPPIPWPDVPPTGTTRLIRDRADAVALFIRWVPFPRDADSGLTYADLARRDLAGRDLACWCPPAGPCHADALLALAAGQRMTTPDVRLPDGGQRIHVQRCCNGCGQPIGDVTEAEINCAIGGRPLPDVRRECPRCSAVLAASPFTTADDAVAWMRATCIDHMLSRGADQAARQAQHSRPRTLLLYLARYLIPGQPGRLPDFDARLVFAAVLLGLPIPKEAAGA